MKTYEKIRQMREEKKWSQEEVATKLNISPSGYAKIERGETGLTLKRLEQLADILETDILHLIQNEEPQCIYQFNNENGGETNQYVYMDSKQNTDKDKEIETLNLIIVHKDELIEQYQERLEQQNRELENLREIIALLKNK